MPSTGSRPRPRRGVHAATGALIGLRAAVATLLAALLVVLMPFSASAHSLDSSTISAHVTDEGVDATITVALDTLDQALGSDYAASGDVNEYADEVVAYLGDHLSVTSVDGTEWGETFGSAERETVEGIDSFSVEVTFDTSGTDTSGFEIAYDAIIEAVPGHEAVVVLTDATGQVSTAGVISGAGDTVTVGEASDVAGTAASGLTDMLGYGFHHVLQGADHLLFLIALLLTAPVTIVAGRWRPRTEVAPTLRAVLAVVTSFTVGHSITLIASALGWVHVPTQLIEVLVAVSVAVAAIHVIRPLVRRGENLIAGGFGLVHGLAFAGILSNLGIDGSTSLVALLAFNVGVELAQLAATAALFPSLYVLARTRHYPAARIIGGTVALVAATGWVLDRLNILTNPLGGIEEAAINHPWVVAVGLATLATSAVLFERLTNRTSRADGVGARASACGSRPM